MARVSTPAQRDASRRNGRNSRGGTSEEARQRSTGNATTAGLRCQTVALMHEAVEYGQRSDQWHSYYSAQSPGVFHIVNECARATLLADRCDRYRQAELEKQTAEKARQWRRKQTRRRRYLFEKLGWCPAEAADQLRAFGEGLRFLILSVEKLISELKSQGFLTLDVVDRSFEIFGIMPGPDSIRANSMAYMIHVYNLGCTPSAPAGAVAGWLEPANRPEELRGVPSEALQGLDADGFRGLLLGLFQAEHDELTGLQAAVERDVDQPSLKAALDGACILTEEAARRVARSHAEARTTFHRAWKELIAALKRGAEQGPPQPAGDHDEDQDEGEGAGGETRPEAEVAVTPTASAEADLPFDPENEAAESAQVTDQIAVYANPSAPGAQGAKPAQSGEQTLPKGADLGANPAHPGGAIDRERKNKVAASSSVPGPSPAGNGAVVEPAASPTSEIRSGFSEPPRSTPDDPLLAVIAKYQREFDAALRPYDHLE